MADAKEKILTGKYLTGAIMEKGGRLADQSVAFLQKGCGLTGFQLPAGHERFSVAHPQMVIATEKNWGLALGVAEKKYHWAIVGLDMVADLPEGYQDRVQVVKSLGFGHCEIKVGVSARYFGVQTLGELRPDVQAPALKDLKPKTRVATKYPNYLTRELRRRHLNLRVIQEATPETAPLRGIDIIVDIARPEETFGPNQIMEGELLLPSQAVLIRARSLTPEKTRLFFSFMQRVNRAVARPDRWLIR